MKDGGNRSAKGVTEKERNREFPVLLPRCPSRTSEDISVPVACYFALGCVTVPSYPQRGVSSDERRPEAAAEIASEGEKE